MLIQRPAIIKKEAFSQQELRQNIQEVQRLNATRTLVGNEHSTSTYRLAKSLYEVQRTEACERTLGIPFRRWVEEFLKDDNGQPRPWSWARQLIYQYRAILHYPPLLNILERQTPDDACGFVNFNSAFVTTRLAEVDEWVKKVNYAINDERVPKEERAKERDRRLALLFYEWGTRSVSVIRSRINEVQADRKDATIPKKFTFVGGPLDPDVKSRYDEAVERAVLEFRGGPENLSELSFTKEVETLVEGFHDMLDAIEEARKGNDSPLYALVTGPNEDDDEASDDSPEYG